MGFVGNFIRFQAVEKYLRSVTCDIVGAKIEVAQFYG